MTATKTKDASKPKDCDVRDQRIVDLLAALLWRLGYLTAITIWIWYPVGALMTNAYCQNCRWEDWSKNGRPEDPYQLSCNMTLAATVFWPVYWASRGALEITKPDSE